MMKKRKIIAITIIALSAIFYYGSNLTAQSNGRCEYTGHYQKFGETWYFICPGYPTSQLCTFPCSNEE